MTFHRIYTHKPTTNISMNVPLFSNNVSHKNKNKKREKVTILEILNFIYKMPWRQSTTVFIAVFYTNFNVTPCDKKCNFFQFFDELKNSTFSRFIIRVIRIKDLFLPLIICLYIRIKCLFYTFLFDLLI